MSVITAFPFTDAILNQYRESIADDFEGYRNHVTRMLNFVHLLKPDLDETQSRKLQIAAAFHDIALWTHDRVDYLDPSVEVCMEYLEQNGLADWKKELALVIDMHHYIKRYQGEHQELVELFRQADLVDFSLGLVKFGLDKAKIKAVKAAIPNAGFHLTLLRFTGKQLLRNPLKPAPMMKFKAGN